MPAATTSTAYVTDEHVVVPADVVDPVVVSFDGQYVWSFVPRRDGSRRLQGWQVPWPVVLRARLDGTTCVRLTDAGGERVHFEAPGVVPRQQVERSRSATPTGTHSRWTARDT